jgi:LacI family transcriptional regulator/LacI family repressor for deo operon, udp, cdd, tsx, nupC, and nupG
VATIKDVAERARVSTATVSYVLNGTGTVTEETRRRVLAAVEELNYQPNHAARSLRTRSRTLGLVLPHNAPGLGDPALAELVAGLTEAAAAQGYYLLLAASPTQPEHELGASLARTGRVEGLVLLDLRAEDKRAALLSAAGVVCVGAGAPAEGLTCPSVGLDLVAAAATATRHLLALGHTRISMIALPSNLADSEPFYQGYADTLEAAGLEADPGLVVEAGTGEADGLAAMQELLARPEPPTAVIAASDTLAFGAMHALRDAGVAAGHDVSLIGCGDLPLAAHTHPPLTTLRAPRRALGAALARALIALVEHKPAPAQGPLPLQLIVRQSTVAPDLVSQGTRES